jgi:hypothetical protein
MFGGASSFPRLGFAVLLTMISATALAAPVSEQIIVDQFGWRAGAPRKVAIFADPISGQNSAVAYTPASTFQLKRVSDGITVFTGNVTSWRTGTTQTQSGDKVWYGDFSSYTTPGDYYILDATNNLQSYNFRLDDAIYVGVLKASARTYYYQRCGTAITSTYGGNWNHPICHTGTGQDLAALQWLNGAPTGSARNVSGGWHDAGDMNKYVSFTGSVMWNLMTACEWNSAAFPDNWGIPESGNGVPDMLDEIKYELDWLLRMQTANGSVCNRVGVTQYTSSSPPNTETIARYYTQPTSWATATAAAHLAHGARLFSAYGSQYPGYSSTLQTAATNAWNWLNSNPNMTPSSGVDGGGEGGSNGGLAAAGGNSDAAADRCLRVLAAAELYKTTANTTYRTYFDTWVKDASTGSSNPLVNNWFDPSGGTDLNRACFVYATTTGATQALVDEIKADLASTLNTYLGYYTNLDDAYRGFMWDGHNTWGSNSIKSEWANLFMAGVKLNVNAGNNAAYTEAAEEYLHYFHGRNPLSWVYLSNMGSKGANVGADKTVLEIYHGWFADGTSLYDGAASTYGPAPGYLAGGPNQFYSGTVAPPDNEPMMKAYRDWNTGWPDNSWEVTEPAIYYQAAYTLLLSHFTPAPPAVVAAPSFSPSPGTYTSAQSVTISTTTSGASIRYTTDGSTPTSTTGTLYSTPVSISVTTTLKAIAYKSGMIDSSVTTGVYTISAGLPSGWSTADIGGPTPTGSASESSGTFTVRGGGADIWGTSDQFRYAYKDITGDTTLVARVDTVQNTNAWAKAGVMIRDGTAANAKNAAVFVTPSNGVTFQRRTSTGGSSTSTTTAGITAPRWVRLVRSGNSFTASYSSNGTSWTAIGSAVTITMGSTPKAGLAVTSHAQGTLNTSTFSNVSVTGGGAPSYNIYVDALATDWANWSWSATVNLANTSPVHGGTNSISTTFTAGWAALSLRKGTAQSTSGFTSVKFWVHGGTGSNKSLQFYSQTADDTGSSPTVPFTATINTWTEITIPLSSLGNPTTIKRINFQEAAGAAQSVIYFDDIRLAP